MDASSAPSKAPSLGNSFSYQVLPRSGTQVAPTPRSTQHVVRLSPEVRMRSFITITCTAILVAFSTLAAAQGKGGGSAAHAKGATYKPASAPAPKGGAASGPKV